VDQALSNIQFSFGSPTIAEGTTEQFAATARYKKTRPRLKRLQRTPNRKTFGLGKCSHRMPAYSNIRRYRTTATDGGTFSYFDSATPDSNGNLATTYTATDARNERGKE
jgi:hypothetical protein